MNKYIKLIDGKYPVHISEIRRENPSTVFPKNPTDEQVRPFGYAVVTRLPIPAHDSATQTVRETAPVEVDSAWQTSWTIEDKPAALLAEAKGIELKERFELESSKDVTSNGLVWKGGANSALTINGKSETLKERARPSGAIHTKDHRPHDFTPAKIREIAADVAEVYDIAYTNYQAKLVELEECGLDSVCIKGITW